MDIFAKIGLINFLVSIFFGIQIIIRKRDWANWAFCLLALSIAFWSFGYWRWLSSYDLVDALFWVKIFTVGSILIPVFFFHWIVVFLGHGKRYLMLILFLIIVSLTLIFNTFFTDLIVEGVQQKLIFPFWPVPGKLYAFYVSFIYVGLVTWALAIMFREFLITKDFNKKFQIKYIFWGSVVGFGGGITNFFLWYGILAPPYLNFLVGVGLIMFYYAASKSNLFEVRVVATEFFTYLLGMGATIRFVFDDDLKNWIIDGLVLFLVIFIGQKLVKSVHKEIEQREKIEKLAEELKQINVGQNSLIHFMNHQIKGRFGVAKNIFAELLTDDYGKMPESTIPLLKQGLEEANTGINYVQSILRGATAENGTLQYDKKEVNFKDLVENVLLDQKEKAEKKGLQFNTEIKDGNYSINVDALQLGEAVRNLLDNSINYTLEGSISVSLSSDDSKILFVVSDTGVGITKDDMKNLFKAGGRGANSLKVNVNSTGYGLVFVKNVVDAHNGKVWVESEGEGKGSTFYIELPKVK